MSGTRKATGSAMCEKKSVSGETSCACRSSQGLTADDALPRSLGREGGGAGGGGMGGEGSLGEGD